MICAIQRLALTLSDVCLTLICSQSTSTYSALEVSQFMRYTNLRLTYLLTYLLLSLALLKSPCISVWYDIESFFLGESMLSTECCLVFFSVDERGIKCGRQTITQSVIQYTYVCAQYTLPASPWLSMMDRETCCAQLLVTACLRTCR